MDFRMLIFNNNIEEIRKKIELGYSPNKFSERGETPLSLAVSIGNIDMINLLLENGAEINLSQKDNLSYTPLINAIRNIKGKNLEVIKLLIEAGADLEKGDSRGGTPLLHSCIGAHKEVLEYLISKGANVNSVDNDGQTPLHYLCKFALEWGGGRITTIINGIEEVVENNRIDEHFDIFKILISNGADVNKITNYGFAPLHLAAQKEGKIFIKPLIEAGAEVNLSNANKYIPLHAAADAGDFKTAYELLKLGADVNSKDKYGFTPLVGAVLSGNISLIHLFMDFGVDREAKVTSPYDIVETGDRAIDVARKKNRQDMVDLLTGI